MYKKLAYHLLPPQTYTCYIVSSLLTSTQCQNLLSKYVKNGFRRAIDNYPTYYRNNQRVVVNSQQLAERMFERVKEYVPSVLEVRVGDPKQDGIWKLLCLNQRIRFCKYGPNQYFNRHLDGIHHRNPTIQSKLTFMLYLNSAVGNFTGGRTLFYTNKTTKQILASYIPKQGDLIVFDHNIWHQGEILGEGTKVVMRSDLVYQKQQQVNDEKGKKRIEMYKQGHQGYIWTLLKWDQNTLLTAGRDKTIKIWNPNHSQSPRALPQIHQNSILSLIKHSKETLISCSRDKTIAIWTHHNNNFQLAHQWIAHDGATVLCLLDINEDIFVSGGADGMIRIWGKDGKQVGVLSGHQDWVWKLVKVGNGMIVSCSEDGTIRGWDWQKRQEIFKFNHHCSAMSLAYDEIENRLYFGDLQGNLNSLDLLTLTKIYQIKSHSGLIRSLHLLTPTTIVTCSEDCQVKLWSTQTQKQLHNFEHSNFAQDAVLIKDKLITASYDGMIRQFIVKLESQ